ncbi:tyrosine-type recombinase/integrase [Chitinivorax sp. PXF-14]|uniref:tyrosine-type recombinase/integrase n=1 Tax=Chitinivorax sp. PXF-14 TaxID=3230488 RepID=UPI0034656998
MTSPDLLRALMPDPPPADEPMSIEDCALLRGRCQGLPMAVLVARYGAEGGLRTLRQTLEARKQQLLARAIRLGQTALAQRLAQPWQPALGPALESLLAAGCSQPTRAAPLWQWWPPRTVARLGRHGLHSVGDCIAWIDHAGPRWWRSLAGVGPKQGAALTRWCWEHRVSLDLPAEWRDAQQVLRARRFVRSALPAAGGALQPLEQIRYPLEQSARLDGSQGYNRAERSRLMIEAGNDREAIACYLAQYHGRPHTLRSYRAELERFLLWTIFEAQRALSDLRVNDCADYLAFLAELGDTSQWRWRQPREAWLGGHKGRRGSDDWRPFAAAPSARSQDRSRTILQAFGGWLVRVRYWADNPWDAVPRQRLAPAPPVDASHALNAAQWRFALNWIEAPGSYPPHLVHSRQRTRCLLYLAYGTGLRRAELCQARLGDLEYVVTDGLAQGYWVIKVIGKGRRARRVPLADRVVAELTRYLAARGLYGRFTTLPPELPLLDRTRDETFAAPSHGDGRTLSTGALYASLKTFFRSCATQLAREGHAGSAERFALASTHWLRHTHATLGLAGGADVGATMRNLGHAHLSTTGIYLSPDELLRKHMLDGLFDVDTVRSEPDDSASELE